jgi:hypothetical protein
MKRTIALGNLLQAALFAAGAWWLAERWGVAAVLAGMCAAAQLAAGVAVVIGRIRLARWASLVSLVGVAIVAGLYIDAAVHLTQAYGSDAAKIGGRSIRQTLTALPWAIAFPLWQVLAAGGIRTLWGPLLVAVLTVAIGLERSAPTRTWPAQPDQSAAAAAAWAIWSGTNPTAALPEGTGPATVLLTPLSEGRPGRTVRANGDGLGKAIAKALDQLTPATGDRAGLVLDVARARYSVGDLVPFGTGGALGKKSGVSPAVAWRPGKMGGRSVLPLWRLPRPKIGRMVPAAFDSVVADAHGVHPLISGWAAPPPLTADTALEAAIAGGDMLLTHQEASGRFAYVVSGTTGEPKGDRYNFPRHAGTSWFLARLAARTGEARFVAGTDKALSYMAENTVHMPDGRAFLRDPRRRGKKTWAGTTGLAALAAVVHGHALAAPYGRFLASTIDTDGLVRGEMYIDSGRFIRKKNPYGQGQVVLALAALVRAGHTEFQPALERGAAYLDGDYAPRGVGRLVALDEHWTCLAALASQEALGTPYGLEVCQGYLAAEADQTPAPDQRIRPHTGSAGGLAEAVVAGAMLDPSGPHRANALSFGALFLRNAFRQGDATLLRKPEGLIGGFRDSPYQLNVRMDAVQHIGCALLGIEALMRSVQPGSTP